jgi:hypothetical protein
MVEFPTGFNPLCMIFNELKLIGLKNYTNLFFAYWIFFHLKKLSNMQITQQWILHLL